MIFKNVQKFDQKCPLFSQNLRIFVQNTWDIRLVELKSVSQPACFRFSKLVTHSFSAYIGFVTSLTPGLVETQTNLEISTSVSCSNLALVGEEASSIFALGSFGKVVAGTSATNVVVFGFMLR